jgi:hypothetical protein
VSAVLTPIAIETDKRDSGVQFERLRLLDAGWLRKCDGVRRRRSAPLAVQLRADSMLLDWLQGVRATDRPTGERQQRLCVSPAGIRPSKCHAQFRFQSSACQCH